MSLLPGWQRADPEVPWRRPQACARAVQGGWRAQSQYCLHWRDRCRGNQKVSDDEMELVWRGRDANITQWKGQKDWNILCWIEAITPQCEAHTHTLNLISCFRYDSNSGGEREIQRTMLELLNQLDGFDARSDTKVFSIFLSFNLDYIWSPGENPNNLTWPQVIMATNRIETLDPALIRPGRIDR